MAIDTVCSSLNYSSNNDTHCLSSLENEAVAFEDLYQRVLSSEEYFRYSIAISAASCREDR